MVDDRQTPPLTRRVPGAARSGPESAARPALPDALMKRMQAAVDAARAGHGEQDVTAKPAGSQAERTGTRGDNADLRSALGGAGLASASQDQEPITEPLPNLQAALATNETACPGAAAGQDHDMTPDGAAGHGHATKQLHEHPRDRKSRPDRRIMQTSGASRATSGEAIASGPRLPVQIWPPVAAPPPGPSKPTAVTAPPSEALKPVTIAPPTENAPSTQATPLGRTSLATRTPSLDRAEAPTRTTSPTLASLPVRTWPPSRIPLPAPTAPSGGAGPSVADQDVPFRASPGRAARRRGPRVASVAALAVVLMTAVAVAVLMSSRTSAETSHSGGSHGHQTRSSSTVTANLAAAWVAAQVTHDAYVACDKVMCHALTAHGFPGSKLKLIRPDSPYPLTAQVVVVTPVVLRQFGSSLATDWAPAVLTHVGSGRTAITIRIVSQHGAAAYKTALNTDVQQRKASAQTLLGSRRVMASPVVRKQLADGLVDSRLIVVLTALASRHPIDILAFGTSFPGASPGIPFRTAELADSDLASGMSRSDYLRYLTTQTRLQPIPYRPQAGGLSHDGAGKLVFRITFAAPSPLLLLGGQGP